jgi:hypothetical protein
MASGMRITLRAISVLGLAMALGVATVFQHGRGEPARVQAALTPAAAQPTRSFFSANDCARCHRSPEVAQGLVPNGAVLPALVRLDEFSIWNERDPHRRAYDVLSGARGKRMIELLGYDESQLKRACLTCHSTGYYPAALQAEEMSANAWKEQGVSCIACHGGYREWVVNHGTGEQLIREWRAKSLTEKSAAYGMTNLRDPETRTRVCASCHVGNAAENKVVTHAIFAAGHPPLPAFESSTFSAAMPRHWFEPDEVPLFQAEPAVRVRYGFEPGENFELKLLVIGAVAAFQDSMKLLAAMAESTGRGQESLRAYWPEFAQMDCYACHHELVSPGYLSWRQKAAGRLYFDGLEVRGIAGRPQFQRWSTALLRVAIAQVRVTKSGAEDRAGLNNGLAGLHAAFSSQPYGDSRAVTREARKLEAWAGNLIDTLRSSRFVVSGAARLLEALVTIPPEDVPDYDSAVQIARGIQVLYSELRPTPANDGAIQAQIQQLNRLLKLDPYERRTATSGAEVPKSDGTATQLTRWISLSEQEQTVSRERLASYNPAEFRRILESLASMLKAQ